MEGVKFCPDDQECIAFLMSKVAGEGIHNNGLIGDDNRLIGDDNPYDATHLPRMFNDAQTRDLYFFTKLTRKGRLDGGSSKNANRKVEGRGTWHGEQKRDVKYGDDGEIIGKAYVFTYLDDDIIYDRWYIMTEYHLLEDRELEYDPFVHGVFCVLRYNKTKETREKKKHKVSDIKGDEDNMKKQQRVLSGVNLDQELAASSSNLNNTSNSTISSGGGVKDLRALNEEASSSSDVQIPTTGVQEASDPPLAVEPVSCVPPNRDDSLHKMEDSEEENSTQNV